jgi:23S rRNA (uracil1939-C5)-methyltransferase
MGKRKRLPPTPIRVSIHALSHDGRGIATVDGKTTFVIGALPGEDVDVKLLKRHSKYDEGVVTEIYQAAPERVEPRCPHFTNCGGCRLQHMPSAMQLQTKFDAFKELMAHHAGVEPKQWAEPLTSHEWGYRRKARISVRNVPKKERVLVGFRELNGRYVADNRECPILIPPVDQLINPLSELIASTSIKDHIPQVELAAGDDHVALMFRHLEPLTDDDLEKLKAFGQTHKLHVYVQPKGYDSLQLIEPQDAQPRLHYELDGITFEFRPEQFVQVNAEMNTKMLSQALRWLELEAEDRVLDLFCGIGNFSLPIAKHVTHVTGIEGDETAVEQARINAKNNGIENTDFAVCNLFELPVKADWINTDYNKLVLDPPRAGAEEIVQKIERFQPETIVYVSCHPATLARDTKTLVDAGYTLEKAGIMDMFPHTQHVEAMALFRKP